MPPHPAQLVGGRVVGTWRLERAVITVEPFGRLAKSTRSALASEAADIGRFLGEELSFRTAATSG